MRDTAPPRVSPMTDGGLSGRHIQRLAESVYESALLDRCAYLKEAGFWSGAVSVDPEGWLANFTDPDSRRHAVHLVGALQYYNLALCEALIVAGLRDVVRRSIAILPTPDVRRYV